jgi:hypothetical protein
MQSPESPKFGEAGYVSQLDSGGCVSEWEEKQARAVLSEKVLARDWDQQN